jgi:AraC family transcriptional regulator, transcriptional activator of pobA
MHTLDGWIVVMRPGASAAGTAVRSTPSRAAQKPGKNLIAGHTQLLFVARGEGTYRVHNRSGVLRPNTLLAAPAGAFACEVSDEHELYVVVVREAVGGIDDKHAFSPFIERRLSTSDGRRWKETMADFTDRASSGRIGSTDVQKLQDALVPYVWRREPNDARKALTGVFDSIWENIAEPLTLERLATGVGYTANYLSDLMREHTGRALGSWIADMRMARARAALEHTDLPVAEVGASVGYDDAAYFSRAFRLAHGVPPATWRIATRPIDARHSDVTIPIDVVHELERRAVLPQRAYSFAS